ncbi:unnamed protein product [Protopolystoma xenopodis]|uniref:Uncharacterized protein n=1 Tax=Protopolystoma xenopodis TaxID=117903 RepID=A0A448WN53_9PLAT|nr:unnamed protein product [Protopolystoma xenopodis]
MPVKMASNKKVSVYPRPFTPHCRCYRVNHQFVFFHLVTSVSFAIQANLDSRTQFSHCYAPAVSLTRIFLIFMWSLLRSRFLYRNQLDDANDQPSHPSLVCWHHVLSAPVRSGPLYCTRELLTVTFGTTSGLENLALLGRTRWETGIADTEEASIPLLPSAPSLGAELASTGQTEVLRWTHDAGLLHPCRPIRLLHTHITCIACLDHLGGRKQLTILFSHHLVCQ